MATDTLEVKTIAGYVMLAVGGALLICAIFLIVCLLVRRRRLKKEKYSDPDQFKVVYKVPTSNGIKTQLASDVRSVRTATRSETGYAYAAPPPRPQEPIVLTPVSHVNMAPHGERQWATLPRPTSPDHQSMTLPRSQYGGSSQLLVPVSRKRVKHLKSDVVYVPAYQTAPRTRSVLSAPSYATAARVSRARTAQRGPGPSGAHLNRSMPNLYTLNSGLAQPVLAYNGNRQYFVPDDSGNDNVRHWLRRSPDGPDGGRPISPTSSVPIDMEGLGLATATNPGYDTYANHLEWSPTMGRKRTLSEPGHDHQHHSYPEDAMQF